MVKDFNFAILGQGEDLDRLIVVTDHYPRQYTLSLRASGQTLLPEYGDILVRKVVTHGRKAMDRDRVDDAAPQFLIPPVTHRRRLRRGPPVLWIKIDW